jgi:hypothetical protein
LWLARVDWPLAESCAGVWAEKSESVADGSDSQNVTGLCALTDALTDVSEYPSFVAARKDGRGSPGGGSKTCERRASDATEMRRTRFAAQRAEQFKTRKRGGVESWGSGGGGEGAHKGEGACEFFLRGEGSLCAEEERPKRRLEAPQEFSAWGGGGLWGADAKGGGGQLVASESARS